jgi:two-component system chemotaxis response regulator CheB
MAKRDIIVIGTSAGGVEALLEVVSGLPSSFPASLFVVCHIPPARASLLPDVLSRAGPLLATHPSSGESFYPGHIYVAPPDHHMLLGHDRRIRLARGPRENGHRPAVDPLFRSAARAYGPRVIGVILSGSLYDGTAGLLAIRGSGGLAVVQDPEDALVAAMPQNAISVAAPEHVVPVAELARLLISLIHDPVIPARGAEPMDPVEMMPDVVEHNMAQQMHNGRRGNLSVFTCPECGGALWQVDETGVLRFRCHVGHAYEAEVLLSEQTEALEAALWTAVRTFKDKSVLATQLANQEHAEGDAAATARFADQANQAARFGELIEQLILSGEPTAARLHAMSNIGKTA